jgi:chemotaxis protein methyltransferase CheR
MPQPTPAAIVEPFARPAAPPPSAPVAPAADPLLARAAQSYADRDYVGAAVAARAAIAAGAHDALGDAPWILLVRALANLGQLNDADRACLEALEHHRSSAELTYLHAVLLLQAGHGAAAVAAARRALYLDRTLAVAHLTLGAALARERHPDQARRAYRSAERLLAAYPPGGIVPASDGETARRLLEAARAQARHLGGAAA